MIPQKHLISPQYLNKIQITVTLLDVLGPVHFVVKESPSLDGSIEAKNFIEAEAAMQDYYQSVEIQFYQLPLKDSIIVVFHKDKFYRAKVIAILKKSAGHLIKVYLVDYGLECSVERDCIYKIANDFLKHPFQAANFKLVGMEPISLVMNDESLNMTYGPVSDWDPSAEMFVHDLLKEVCNAYIEIQTTDEKCIYGKLFICYGNDVKKCVNDELVSNKFARFNENFLETVQNEAVDNANSESRISTTPKSSKLQESTSKQMSSPASSDSELDFKVRFVSPEGKIIAESSFMELPTEDKLQSESVSPSDNIVAESSMTECSNTEDNLQSESVGQKRFLRLQQLHKKKLRSPISPSNDVPTAEHTMNENIAPSDDSSAEIKNLSDSFKDSKELGDHETVSPCNSNAIESSNLNVAANQAGSKTSPRIDETDQTNQSEPQTVGQQRLLKLQQLRRKQLSSPIRLSTCEPTSVNKMPTVVESAVNMEVSSADVCTEKADNCTEMVTEPNNNSQDLDIEFNELDVSCDSNSNSNSSFNLNISISSVSGSNLKQESIAEDQLIAQKRFEKLRQLSRKKLKSPLQAESSIIKSSPAEIEIETSQTNVSTASIENRCDISLNCSSSDSPKTSQSNTSNNYVEVPTESSPKQENISEDQLIAQKRFERLQLMAKKKLKSPIVSDSTSVKSSPIETEIEVSMKNVSIESPENSYDISCKSVSCDSPVTPNITKNCVEVPTDSSSKQENSSEVVLEHVNTLQRLRNRVRRKLMDSPLQLTDELSNAKQIAVDTEQVKASSSSIISNSLGQNSNLDQTFASQIQSCAPEKIQALSSKQNELSQKETSRTVDKAESINNKMSMNTRDKNHTSPTLNNDEYDRLLQDVSTNDMGSSILNELLNTSDSDDFLSRISTKRSVKETGEIDVLESFIELSTELPPSKKKPDFTSVSFWEQQVPILEIGHSISDRITNIEEAQFSKHLNRVLKEIKFLKPTPLQSAVWPLMNKHQSMILIAPPNSAFYNHSLLFLGKGSSCE